MNQKYRLLLNEGFLFFAFGAALNGHQLSACIFASAALLCAVFFHSVHMFERHLPKIALCFLPQLYLIDACGLNDVIPSIAFLSLVSVACADLWMQSSEKAIGSVMKGNLMLMVLFLILSLSLDNLYYGTVSTCLITMLIFLPSSAGYLIREIRYRKRVKIHPVNRKSTPAVE